MSDIGFLVGVDQTYYRHHAVNLNKRDFSSGTVHGQLIDLKQRWQSFGAQFAGVGGKAPRFYRSPAKPWRVKHWSVSTMPRQEAVGTFHQGASTSKAKEAWYGFAAASSDTNCRVGVKATIPSIQIAVFLGCLLQLVDQPSICPTRILVALGIS
ncbi:hypothetical protein HB773_17610 (plasmid) [Sinorhizobium meliloti]|nr:hypothetical protein HB773_17610 [Sinorhizobium meliloti]